MKRNLILIILSIATLIFISGCTAIKAGDGLALSLYADPPTIFGNDYTTLHVDLDNKDVKTLENVVVDVFDTGLLRIATTEDWQNIYTDKMCWKRYESLKPGQFDTFSCSLYAPEVKDQRSLQTDVNVKATFNTEFSVVQLVELMTANEYERRIASNKFVSLPQSYSYSDNYVQLQIDFSEQLPIIVRPGKKYFIYFTIKNIGNGFIDSIAPDDFYFEQRGDIIACKSYAGGRTYIFDKIMEPVGKEFPRTACEILMPTGLPYLENYEMVIHLKYSYEIRDKITVNIVR
jgi:hypothetical protein